MKQAFLEKLADLILQKHIDKGDRLQIVMPNRRAGLFLQRHLAGRITKPVWIPGIFPIEDYVSFLTGLEIPDALTLMTTLYEAHRQTEGSRASGFDEFYSWGRGLIRDFEDVDQYLVEPGHLFTYLSETKALSLWNMNERQLTDFEQRYLQFFNSLPEYYRHYSEELLKQGTATHGLACRLLASDPQRYAAKGTRDHVIFAGFNALTPAQLTFIRHLLASENASLFWDADAYYINNPQQEAGIFLRKYKEDHSLGEFGEVSDFFTSAPHTITFAGATRMNGQAQLAGKLLRNLIGEKGPEVLNQTAVVLADETLLLPLLNAIPPETGAYNITMGFPLQQSPLFTLTDTLIELYVHSRPGRIDNEPEFYYRHLLDLLQHNNLSLPGEAEGNSGLSSIIRKSNRAFLSYSDIAAGTGPDNPLLPLLHALLTGEATAEGVLKRIVRLLDHLRNLEETFSEGSVNSEILFHIASITERLRTLTGSAGFVTELRTLHALFRESAAATPVAFYGEPLKGVQVMGMLETRLLDFEYLILVGANEDILPAARSYNSFIPFDIRREFGLPTHHEHQAVFAYHFYRLLQRCSHAWLIYNAIPGDLGSGERSRFLNQLAFEMPAYSKSVVINELTASASPSTSMPLPVRVDKDPDVIARLMQLAGSGFSPTALSSYLQCRLKFYFRYILRVDEEESMEDTIDNRTLGTVIHEVLQNFYTPFINSFPGGEDYSRIATQIPDAVAQALKKHYPGGDIQTGRNLLIRKLAETWIGKFLETEAEMKYNPSAGSFLIALERQLKTSLLIPIPNGEMREVALTGKADRIDRHEGVTRIIDYKTGKVSPKDLEIKETESLLSPPHGKIPNDKAFQLMFYLLLAERSGDIETAGTALSAGIITFRSLKNGFIPLNLTGTGTSAALQSFEDGLKNLFTEMFDETIPFAQTENQDNCRYCPYKAICSIHADKQTFQT